MQVSPDLERIRELREECAAQQARRNASAITCTALGQTWSLLVLPPNSKAHEHHLETLRRQLQRLQQRLQVSVSARAWLPIPRPPPRPHRLHHVILFPISVSPHVAEKRGFFGPSCLITRRRRGWKRKPRQRGTRRKLCLSSQMCSSGHKASNLANTSQLQRKRSEES